MNTYTLKTPVSFKDKTYSSLTLRKPKVADLMALDAVKGELSQSIAFTAKITDVPIQVIQELDLIDFKGVSEMAAPFMAGFQESKAIGET